jgi:P pilus assembly protein, pilin FimA
MLTCFILMAVSQPIMAANSTQLKVSGSIYTRPCTLAPNQTNKTVAFETLSPKSGVNPGVLQTVDMSLLYMLCPKNAQYATVSISGTPDTQVKDGAYANKGTAKNIAILIKSGSRIMSNETPYSLSVTGENQLKQFPLTASVVSRGNATSGTIQAEVTFTISFL